MLSQLELCERIMWLVLWKINEERYPLHAIEGSLLTIVMVVGDDRGKIALARREMIAQWGSLT
jgi:hypothetical protein